MTGSSVQVRLVALVPMGHSRSDPDQRSSGRDADREGGFLKRCWSCGETKPLDAYPRNRARPDGRGSTCRPCHRDLCRSWYRANRDEARERAHDGRIRRRSEGFDRIRAYLVQHPCVDCGESDPDVLGFDHRRLEDKSFNISTLLSAGYSWDKVLAEIRKCDVRCANCHQRRTAQQFEWPRAKQ